MRLPRDVQAAVQELIALEKALAPMRAPLKRYEELKRELQVYCNHSDASMPVTLSVTSGSVTYSANSSKTVLAPNPKIVKVIGQARALEICTFTLTALEAVCDAEMMARLSTKEVGPRSLKAVLPR